MTLVSVTALLMTFSVISWVLSNTTLAAVAGTGACTLAADIGRRLLGSGSQDTPERTNSQTDTSATGSL